MQRRLSLFAPLLLILLGTLLLVRNFHPEFPFWELVAKYWPGVLIVWGVAKLAQALAPPVPGRPAWRPSLTVGEFFLALLLVLFGLAADKWKDVRDHMYLFDVDWPWSQSFTIEQSLTQEVEPSAAIRVENPSGDVRLSGSEASQITVSVRKQIRANSETEAKTLAAQFSAEVVREADAYVVRIGTHARLQADMHITVPRAAAVTLEARHGSVQATDLQAGLSAEVAGGDVTLSDITGNVQLRMRRGSLSAQNIQGNVEVDGRGNDLQVADITGHLAIRGRYSGASNFSRIAQGVRFSSGSTEMEIHKLPGKLEMTIGSLTITEPDGLVSISARNQDILIKEFPGQVRVANHGASVKLSTSRLPLHKIGVENDAGPIELAIPAGSEFQIEATTRRGDVESEFTELNVQRETEAGSIRGKIGAAGASIRLHTTYGPIRLKKLIPKTFETRRRSGVMVLPAVP